jgi:hypothetical protein
VGIRNEASPVWATIEGCRNHTLRRRALSSCAHVAIRTHGEGHQIPTSLALEDLVRDVQRFSSTVVRYPARQLVASRSRTAEGQGIAVEGQVVDGARVVRRPQVCRTCDTAEQRQNEWMCRQHGEVIGESGCFWY